MDPFVDLDEHKNLFQPFWGDHKNHWQITLIIYFPHWGKNKYRFSHAVLLNSQEQRRRINTEGKAKVFAAVWGTCLNAELAI